MFNMRLFILLSLISFGVSAETIRTFEKYKNNFELLNHDISRMEGVLQKNNNTLAAEMLKDMTTLKLQFDHIANPLSLNDLAQDAQDHGWMNLQRMSKELAPACETSAAQNTAACKSGLSQMRSFAFNSKLSAENKDSIYSFLDDYSAQMKAFEVITPAFIARFNKNSAAINAKIEEATKKLTPPVALTAKSEEVSGTTAIANDLDRSKTEYFFFVLALGVILYGANFLRNLKNEKTVNSFYSKLFTLAKKSNIQLRVFGNLTTTHVSLVKKIQLPFLNSVYLSRAVSNNAQVKFKNKKNNVSIEVSFTTSRSLQNVMEMPKEKAFKESVEALQAAVESDGGEFVYSNRFNSLGELVQSSLILHMPK
jgi:hypothetical protein